MEIMDAILASDPPPDEVGFIAVEEGEGVEAFVGLAPPTTTPATICVNERKLAIASWCVPSLRTQVVQRWKAFRKTWKPSSSSESSLSESMDAVKAADQITRAMALLTPDNNTCWNVRKHLLKEGLIPFGRELDLLDLIFSYRVKSGETWWHRKWVLQTWESRAGCVQYDVHRELSIASHLARVHPKNYHAWTFKRYVASKLTGDDLVRELESSKEWVTQHISDHSGHHYRQFLMERRLAQGVGNVEGFWLEEECNMMELCGLYPDHEALWCHLRFVAAQRMIVALKGTEDVQGGGGGGGNANDERISLCMSEWLSLSGGGDDKIAAPTPMQASVIPSDLADVMVGQLEYALTQRRQCADHHSLNSHTSAWCAGSYAAWLVAFASSRIGKDNRDAHQCLAAMRRCIVSSFDPSTKTGSYLSWGMMDQQQ